MKTSVVELTITAEVMVYRVGWLACCNLCERTDYSWKTVSMKCCQLHWKSRGNSQGIWFGMESGHPVDWMTNVYWRSSFILYSSTDEYECEGWGEQGPRSFRHETKRFTTISKRDAARNELWSVLPFSWRCCCCTALTSQNSLRLAAASSFSCLSCLLFCSSWSSFISLSISASFCLSSSRAALR